MKYKDKDTGEIETYSEVENYYKNNPEIKSSFDSVEDLISQFYEEVEQ